MLKSDVNGKRWISESSLEDKKIGTENCREHLSSTQEIGRNSLQKQKEQEDGNRVYRTGRYCASQAKNANRKWEKPNDSHFSLGCPSAFL